jgi:hypothetical protein
VPLPCLSALVCVQAADIGLDCIERGDAHERLAGDRCGRRHLDLVEAPPHDLARLDKAAIAIEAVKRIDALFATNREINGLAPQERGRVRNERSRPLVAALESWLREQCAKLSNQSTIAKAIACSLARWAALTRFLDDGRLCVSQQRGRAGAARRCRRAQELDLRRLR